MIPNIILCIVNIFSYYTQNVNVRKFKKIDEIIKVLHGEIHKLKKELEKKHIIEPERKWYNFMKLITFNK